MKRRMMFLLLALTAVFFIGAASAAGGDAGDPLISLSFLNGVFSSRVDTAVGAALDASDEKLLGSAKTEWQKILALAEANAGSEHTATFRESYLKQNDILSGPTGLQIIVLSGSVQAQFSSGTMVDVTSGSEIASSALLTPNHRYLVAENTTALVSVSSKSAVVDYCGSYSLTYSATPDYPAMADALRELKLFRGTGAGYGSGFELEKAPTRTEALIMLIRLLGEEDAALACTARPPFTDVADWAERYVAYAYEKGYSNGVGGALFGSTMEASAQMYTEFILRALGYSSTAQSDISDALTRALSCGVITYGECAALQAGSFLRADVTYLSYYALSAKLNDGSGSLAQKLLGSGVFTAGDYTHASALVTTPRL